MTAATFRDDTFEFIKGVLVLLIVRYHILSITSVAAEEHFRNIRFILRESPIILRRGDGRTTSCLLPNGYMLMLASVIIALSSAGGSIATWIMLGVAMVLAAAPTVWLSGHAGAAAVFS